MFQSKWKRPTRVFALLVLSALPLVGQHEEAIVQGRRVMNELVSQRVPGASVAVWLRGKSIWSEGFGWADIEGKRKAGLSSQYRIGSISKPLTAAAIGRLLEAGKLNLDSDIRLYVPSFPEKKHTVTLRQLGGHTAGIRHYKGMEFHSRKHYTNVIEPLNVFASDALLFEPGTRFFYTTYGWTLISAAVASVSEQPFLKFMNETVFGPLKMTSTTADIESGAAQNKVAFYRRGLKGAFTLCSQVDLSNKWAGGGYLSTADDVARFASAHYRPGYHKQSTLKVLHTSCSLTNGKQTNYGFGWTTKMSGGRRVVGHTGGSVGGTCLMKLWPTEELVVVVLTNLGSAKLGNLGARLADPFLVWVNKNRGARVPLQPSRKSQFK